MPSLWDRLTGRSESTAKAVVGTGAYWMEHGVPLRSISRDPLRFIAEAQKVYRSNEWVNAAESLIDAKFATVPFHLERDGETIEDEPAILALLRNPSRAMSRTQLWRLTCRHLGLTGNAFWYLDQMDDLGTPLSIVYINPARMTPATDQRGVLRGWIVDADRPNGQEPIPLTAEEVIQFVLDPPDFGHYGIGKVEAAWRKIGLSNASGQFAEGTFLSGGRKAHMIWPGEGVTVEGEAWDQWVNNLRSVQNDGTFTSRLTANKFPIDSMEVGQTMAELQVPDISQMARDDILAIWGVPPSQLGITAAAGLNSGERQKYEEAALWQNAIEPRIATFAETLQARLIDVTGLTLVLEVQEFDDDKPLYEIAAAAKDVPLKVDERRALVGLDPLDTTVYGDLGQMVLIANSIVELTEKQDVPDNLVPFAGRQSTGRDDDDAEMPETGVTGKARLVISNRLRAKYVRRLDEAVAPVLAAQAADLAKAVERKAAHIAAKPGDTDAWWNESREHQRLERAILPIVESLVAEAGTQTAAAFFAQAKASNFIDRVLDYVRLKVGDRIRGINATTRDAIRALVGEGVAEGLGPRDLAERITAATSFNAARADLIARTETGLAYNDAAIGTYRQFEVKQVQAIDGDEDAECAARNGQTFSLDEASGITDHPNGTLDWVPVVKATIATVGDGSEDNVTPQQLVEILEVFAKASSREPISIHLPDSLKLDIPPAQVNVPAPVVNVSVPEQAPPVVNVPEPFININAPAAAKADGPQEVVVTKMPRRVHSAVRGKDGKVNGSVEEDA